VADEAVLNKVQIAMTLLGKKLEIVWVPDYTHFMGSTVALLGNTKKNSRATQAKKTVRVEVPDYAHFMGYKEKLCVNQEQMPSGYIV
jgi:hypothetical protein